MSFEVAEGEGFASPDDALEGQRLDLRLPAGELVVVEAGSDHQAWEVVNDQGDVLARISAIRTAADEWWLSHAVWCYR